MASIMQRVIQSYTRKNNIIRYLGTKGVVNEATNKAEESSEIGTVTISESCKKRLKDILKDDSFLRVSVEGGGCSGFQYKFDIDTKLNDDDVTFGDKGAQVVVDTVSLEYCSGATVDFHSELIRSGFRIIQNPKAEQGCSCGASFALKLD